MRGWKWVACAHRVNEHTLRTPTATREVRSATKDAAALLFKCFTGRLVFESCAEESLFETDIRQRGCQSEGRDVREWADDIHNSLTEMQGAGKAGEEPCTRC